MVLEETKRNTRNGITSKTDEEEKNSLAGKGNKAKGKKEQGKAESNHNHGKKKDLSKIKCFHYHEYGYYATKCLHKKSDKEPTVGVGGDALAS